MPSTKETKKPGPLRRLVEAVTPSKSDEPADNRDADTSPDADLREPTTEAIVMAESDPLGMGMPLVPVARQTAAKPASAKKKSVTKKVTAKKKATAKKAPAKKTTAAKKTTSAKKSPAKKSAPAKKATTAKKSPATKKASAKKSPAKKSSAKKSPTKKASAARR